jgi:hypothetical protein
VRPASRSDPASAVAPAAGRRRGAPLGRGRSCLSRERRRRRGWVRAAWRSAPAGRVLPAAGTAATKEVGSGGVALRSGGEGPACRGNGGDEGGGFGRRGAPLRRGGSYLPRERRRRRRVSRRGGPRARCSTFWVLSGPNVEHLLATCQRTRVNCRESAAKVTRVRRRAPGNARLTPLSPPFPGRRHSAAGSNASWPAPRIKRRVGRAPRSAAARIERLAGAAPRGAAGRSCHGHGVRGAHPPRLCEGRSRAPRAAGRRRPTLRASRRARTLRASRRARGTGSRASSCPLRIR